MYRPGLTILLACHCLAAAPAWGQTLDGIRSEVREQKPPRDRPQPRRPATHVPPGAGDYDFEDGDDNASFGAALRESLIEAPLKRMAGQVFLAGASLPFLGPRRALDDTGEPGYFPRYPYRKHDGSLLLDSSRRGAHSSLVVVQGDYGLNFDSLTQFHGRVFGDIKGRFGFDGEFFYRREELRPGSDRLWHGDMNLTYRFAQSEHLQFRAGLGVNWLTDDFDTNAGFNTTYGVEWFPAEPWSVTGSLDWGRIGSTSLLHLRNTIGVTKRGWGVFTGYDYLSIGDDRIHSWINGIEYRF